MAFFQQLKQEHLLIVGFSERTGLAVAQYLSDKDIPYSISDSRDEGTLSPLLKGLKVQPRALYAGKQDSSQLAGVDRVILSPGVPRAIPLIQEAQKNRIPVTGEVELAYLLSPAGCHIGITGTDGKTTTTTLCYEILKRDFSVWMGGNIGVPFISFVDELNADSKVILELSSYMLEEIPHLNCNIASVLNVSPDHLDRYNSFEDYLEAKKNLLRMQSETDHAVLNMDDPHYERLSQDIRSGILSFSKDRPDATAFIRDSEVIYQGRAIVSLVDIPLRGQHNLENILAAVLISKLAGVRDSSIQEVIREFKGLPHRNETVDELGGILFINDSKATTINSVAKSLVSQDRGIILLIGGKDKGLDFGDLRHAVESRVKSLILFGEAREKIRAELQYDSTILVGDLEEAFSEALKVAVEGDVVLLSPGCTSFDQYQSYEERGNHFRELVMRYKKANETS